MSTASRYPIDLGYALLRIKAEGGLALGETPERHELTEGVVVMSPSPNVTNKRVARWIVWQDDSRDKDWNRAAVFDETDVRRTEGRPIENGCDPEPSIGSLGAEISGAQRGQRAPLPTLGTPRGPGAAVTRAALGF